MILSSLAGGPKHGYALTADIEEFAGVRLQPGTLNGALSRLEKQGLIESLEADARRLPYRLTDDGGAALHAHLTALDPVRDGDLVTGVERLYERWGPWRVDRFLSWYPAPWRARDGQELEPLLHDAIESGHGGAGLTPNMVRESAAAHRMLRRRFGT